MSDTDKTDIDAIQEENDIMIMWAFGLDYHKLFPQEHQDES